MGSSNRLGCARFADLIRVRYASPVWLVWLSMLVCMSLPALMVAAFLPYNWVKVVALPVSESGYNSLIGTDTSLPVLGKGPSFLIGAECRHYKPADGAFPGLLSNFG